MDRVEMLAGSIEENGQIHPIIVREADEKGNYQLIDGQHRIAACLKLSRDVDAIVVDVTDIDERLIEVDANLMYAPLTALQRCVFLSRRKDVYEELHPETKNGAQGGRGNQKNENGILPFSKDTAERVGLSRTTIERAVSVAKKLHPDVLRAISGTDLEDKRAELEALAKESHARQKKVVKKLQAKKEPPATVKAAIDQIDGKVSKAEIPADEKKLQALMTAWDRAPQKVRNRFLKEIGATLAGDAT